MRIVLDFNRYVGFTRGSPWRSNQQIKLCVSAGRCQIGWPLVKESKMLRYWQESRIARALTDRLRTHLGSKTPTEHQYLQDKRKHRDYPGTEEE